MFLSAVKVGVAIATGVGNNPQQLDAREQAAWQRIEPSVAIVQGLGTARGAAALIDTRGYFIAHKSVVSAPPMFARLSGGETVQMERVAIDETTQLVLLKAQGWISGRRTPARVISGESPRVQNANQRNALRLLAALPNGPMRVEMVDADRPGVMEPSRRMLPLSEIRFEAPTSSVVGALAFTLDGQLAGVLGATLERQDSLPAMGITQLKSRDAGGFGPVGLTVGYSVSPDILRRVVDGFLSPGHQVLHPALGLMCKEAPGSGALVESVQKGSAAEAAGLRAGDVIVQINGEDVANQFEYAKVLLRQKVGESVQVKIRRGGETLTLPVKVGSG
ncbi:MAG TPA: PDZ domain-containing protein [Fimbriimonadaceae bacterium]|nr:PDZ domain-containing protein [Fimbriimonadaceae bacterium]